MFTVEPEAGYVAAGNTAVSCAKGNIVPSADPPEVAAQLPIAEDALQFAVPVFA